MVLDPIPQSLPVRFFGSRPQPPTSRQRSALSRFAIVNLAASYVSLLQNIVSFIGLSPVATHNTYLSSIEICHSESSRELLYATVIRIFDEVLQPSLPAALAEILKSQLVAKLTVGWLRLVGSLKL